MKSLLLAALIGLCAISAKAVPTLETFFEQDNWHITWYQYVTGAPVEAYPQYLNGIFLGNGSPVFDGYLSEAAWPFAIGSNQGSVIIGGVEYFGDPFTIVAPTGPDPVHHGVPDAASTALLLVFAFFSLHFFSRRLMGAQTQINRAAT